MNQDKRNKNRSGDQRAARGRSRSKATEGSDRRAFIGRHKSVSDLAETYRDLSGDDEQAAIVLQREGQYRQAVYFFLQAMEKLARYAVFSEVGPDDASIDGRTYRERTRTHNLDELLIVLLEAYKETINNSRVSEQIEQQMEAYVLQGQYFGVLHNDVRYPRYIERRKSDALLELNEKDAVAATDKLTRLKAFVAGFQQLKGLRSADRTTHEPTEETSQQPTPVWDFKF
jgi:HEPN domain-containing protein